MQTAEKLKPQSTAEAEWYATDGVLAIGPVSVAEITRQVAARNLSGGAYVRHRRWRVWRSLEEIRALCTTSLGALVLSLAEYSGGALPRVRGPESIPPPPDVPLSSAEPCEVPTSHRRVSVVDAVGLLAQAESIEEALPLVLCAAVVAAGAQVGLLAARHPESNGLVISYGLGDGAEQLLGECLPPSDPTATAAKGGGVVIGEPMPGPVGRQILGRIRRCLPNPSGIVMLPLVLNGSLRLTIELGRCGSAFRARDVARSEDVLVALSERACFLGWLETT